MILTEQSDELQQVLDDFEFLLRHLFIVGDAADYVRCLNSAIAQEYISNFKYSPPQEP